MRLVRLNESQARVEDLRDGSEGRKKVYILHKHEYRMRRGNRDTDWIGTVDQLRKAFGYTLEVGNSYDRRINRNPTTARSLETNLNKSYNVKYGSTYSSVSVEIEPYTG